MPGLNDASFQLEMNTMTKKQIHLVELLLGVPYFRTQRLLQKTQFASADEIEDLQRVRLAEVLALALRTIPYYQGLMNGWGQTITRQNSKESLLQFPLMTKEIVRQEVEGLHIPSAIRTIRAATGGSSASPMPFYMDRFVTRQVEKAFMWDQWSRVGYRPGDAWASFTGNVPYAGRIYEHDRLFNKYVFLSFDFTRFGVQEIVAALNRIRPTFLHGYPSVLTNLARAIRRHRATLDFTPRAILCGSEKTFDHQRDYLEEVFQSRVFSWYGHSEYCVLGGECEHSHAFHLYPQYGYVEFLPVNAGHPSGKPLYEIVATGFNNPIMPFIRYRTGDFAVLAEGSCPCGRHYPLVQEVVGRLQEFLVDKEENLISLSALTSLFEKLPFIDEIALAQDKPGEFVFSILPGQTPSPAELEDLKKRIVDTTSGRLIPTIELVKAIPSTAGGKRRLVDQHIDIDHCLTNQEMQIGKDYAGTH